MEETRSTDYLIQCKTSAINWFTIETHRNDAEAFARLAWYIATFNKNQYRIIERTTTETVLPF